MAEHSAIEWTDHTWSPWIGCTKVSPACDGCYAEHLMDTRMGRVTWGPHGERSRTSADYWRKPLAWDKQAAKAGRMLRVFPSLCDPFDNQADPAVRREWFDLVRATPNLLWLALTKRPQNIVAMAEAAGGLPSNMALGTTCEDQKRTMNLFHLAVAARTLAPPFTFASFEPLLGPLDPTRVVLHEGPGTLVDRPEMKTARLLFDALRGAPSIDLPPLGWAITGGATDQGKYRAPPSHPDWYRAIRDACAAAGVPYLHKQNGEWLAAGDWYATHPVSLELREWDGERWVEPTTDVAEYVARIGKKAAGRLLDGVEHNGMPAVIAANLPLTLEGPTS